MRSEYEMNRVVGIYSDMLKRICVCHLKNSADAEDIFQEVFLKYMLYEGVFENAEHEKAWLIRVAVNACKDHLKSLFRHPTLPLDLITEEAASMEPEHKEILEAVLSLPSKYKNVVYLHYYEGYSAAEIAAILKTKENTVYSHLSRGRAILKKKLGDDSFDE